MELPPAPATEKGGDPYKPVVTVGDMADQLVKTRAALQACYKQLDAISEWKKSVEHIFNEATDD